MAGLASLQKKEAREYWLSAGLENEINACVRIINNFDQTGGIVFPPDASVEQKTAAASACRAFQSHFYNFSTNYTAVRKYLESQTKDVEAVEYLAPKIKKTDAALANLTRYAPLIEKELQNFAASHIVLTTPTSDSPSPPVASSSTAAATSTAASSSAESLSTAAAPPPSSQAPPAPPPAPSLAPPAIPITTAPEVSASSDSAPPSSAAPLTAARFLSVGLPQEVPPTSSTSASHLQPIGSSLPQ